MPQDWRALGLGRVMRDPAQDPVAGFLGRALGLDQPSLLDKMVEQGRMQQRDPATGMAPGLPPPGSPEAMAGLDVASNFDLGGIIAGPKALTANKDMLRRAEKMADIGYDAPLIYKETGWFKGPDGDWKFEIDDSRSGLWTIPSSMREGSSSSKLANVFRHPELKQAYYPERSMQPDVFYQDLGEYLGMRYPGDPGQIHISNKIAGKTVGPQTERSTMLHELQHMVQERENFPRGGNLEEFKPAYELEKNRLKERQAALSVSDKIKYVHMNPIEASEQTAKSFGLDPEKLRKLVNEYSGDELEQSLKKIRERLNDLDPSNRYRRLAGEAEARVVQARRDLTPKQRRARFPLDDYDVPLDKLIVRR